MSKEGQKGVRLWKPHYIWYTYCSGSGGRETDEVVDKYTEHLPGARERVQVFLFQLLYIEQRELFF